MTFAEYAYWAETYKRAEDEEKMKRLKELGGLSLCKPLIEVGGVIFQDEEAALKYILDNRLPMGLKEALWDRIQDYYENIDSGIVDLDKIEIPDSLIKELEKFENSLPPVFRSN